MDKHNDTLKKNHNRINTMSGSVYEELYEQLMPCIAMEHYKKGGKYLK